MQGNLSGVRELVKCRTREVFVRVGPIAKCIRSVYLNWFLMISWEPYFVGMNTSNQVAEQHKKSIRLFFILKQRFPLFRGDILKTAKTLINKL